MYELRRSKRADRFSSVEKEEAVEPLERSRVEPALVASSSEVVLGERAGIRDD